MNSTIKAAAGLLFTLYAVTTPLHAAPDIITRTIPLNVTVTFDPFASMSSDGRYVAYYVPLGNGVTDIYVQDLTTGQQVRANLSLTGSPKSAAGCSVPSMSANGRYVVFGCISSAMGGVTTGTYGYFVYDRETNSTEMIPDTGADKPTISGTAISADGRYVAFRTVNAGIVTKIYVRDMVNKMTTLTNAQIAQVGSTRMSISADGRYIAFQGKTATNVSYSNVSVYDRVTGVTESLDVRPDGSRTTFNSAEVTMSEDGSAAAFVSYDNSLVLPASPANSYSVYVRDRKSGITERINGSVTGNAAISGNGRYVAYPINRSTYVYDRLTKVARKIPIGTMTADHTARFSADGRYLAFGTTSAAGNQGSLTIADLGAAAGVALSTKQLSLTEGGIAGTYTVVLTQAPDADVKVKVAPDNQLSVARTELVFTPANWNVPQVVSVQAIQDGVVEGAHSGVITHTVTSTDVNYTVVTASTVTVAITDAIVPTLVLPGATWNQTDLPLNGTAAPNATVLLTATNRNTGWSTAISTVADTQGRWSYTLTGLTDGVIEFDVQADGLHGLPKTITVALPTKTIDVTASIKRTAYGLVFNRSTGLYVGDFTLTNIGTAALSGPLQLQFDSLTAGVTLTNASGTHNGAPYIAVADGLAAGASVTVSLQFSNPAKGAVEYVEKIYSGSF